MTQINTQHLELIGIMKDKISMLTEAVPFIYKYLCEYEASPSDIETIKSLNQDLEDAVLKSFYVISGKQFGTKKREQ